MTLSESHNVKLETTNSTDRKTFVQGKENNQEDFSVGNGRNLDESSERKDEEQRRNKLRRNPGGSQDRTLVGCEGVDRQTVKDVSQIIYWNKYTLPLRQLIPYDPRTSHPGL